VSTGAAGGRGQEEIAILRGWPPIHEYVALRRTFGDPAQVLDAGPLLQEWREANAHLRELAESGPEPDAPLRLEPLPAAVLPQAERLRRDPLFARSFNLVPTEVRLVGLPELIVHQKYVNRSYVRALAAALPPSPGPRELFDFCLPPPSSAPPALQVRRLGPNSYAFESPSTDLRFLEPVLLRPEQVSGYAPSGRVGALLALAVGHGGNLLSVVEAEGRLLLQNGSHRACALLQRGIHQVPAVVQHARSREELAFLVPDLGSELDLYLRERRPPLLRDYLDERLCTVARAPRRTTQVRIEFRSFKGEV
jgi:hypothetical protein